MSNVIDLDAHPFVPDGWTVEEHRKAGQWNFDPNQVELFFASDQTADGHIFGTSLRKELADKPVFNANLLDYLLANPHLIPEEWKDNDTYFWGTVYRRRGGGLCVRCLYWDDGRWNWSYDWLDDSWDSISPAAIRASGPPNPEQQASHGAVQVKGRIRSASINLQLLRHPRSEPDLYDAARFPSTINLTYGRRS